MLVLAHLMIVVVLLLIGAMFVTWMLEDEEARGCVGAALFIIFIMITIAWAIPKVFHYWFGAP